ncbi:uncharacterized protein LOC124158176 [Ischnura elegans]|uniref:uncharacterized protein LOC124158176 n=1 Tax=Ischnura elegans TaxID=197161 RepID=UPI001ED8AC51|nr:uncharacterized protein LOC124158176 [Ischnura elegans]
MARGPAPHPPDPGIESRPRAPRRSPRPSKNPNPILPLVFLLVLAAPARPDCPPVCECKWKSGKESVSCVGGALTAVPTALEAGTQVLDLTGNTLTALPKDAFISVGLANLQKISLAKCGLRRLDRNTFRALTNLVELDLSGNALPAIPSLALSAVPELRELRLGGNPIRRLPDNAFSAVTRLVRLDLGSCALASVSEGAFTGLAALQFLRLDGNRLTAVRPAAVLGPLTALQGVALTNNPWDCSCALRPLRGWMLEKNVPALEEPPTCFSPPRLEGRPWDKLNMDELACTPGVSATPSTQTGVEGTNVTLTCTVEGEPQPSVRWFWRHKEVSNQSSPSVASLTPPRKLYLLETGPNNLSTLTLSTADTVDAGVYVCVAENKAGKAEANVTLAISRKLPDAASALAGRVLVAGIIVAALSALAACMVLFCVCSVRRRRRLMYGSREGGMGGNGARRRDDSYEKIEMNHKGPGMNHTGGGGGGGGRNPGPGGGGAGGVGNGSGASGAAGAVTASAIKRRGDYRGVPCTDSDVAETPVSVVGGASVIGGGSMGGPEGPEGGRGGRPWGASRDGVGSDSGANGDSESACQAESEGSEVRSSVVSEVEVRPHRLGPYGGEIRDEVKFATGSKPLSQRPHGDFEPLNTSSSGSSSATASSRYCGGVVEGQATTDHGDPLPHHSSAFHPVSEKGHHPVIANRQPLQDIPLDGKVPKHYPAPPQRIPNNIGTEAATALSPATDEEGKKNFPDLLEINPYTLGASIPSTTMAYSTNPSSFFCTLPRRKCDRGHVRYRSGGGGGGCSDSQSPLLPDGSYGSSEGSSNTSTRRSSAGGDSGVIGPMNKPRLLGLSNPACGQHSSTNSLNLAGEAGYNFGGGGRGNAGSGGGNRIQGGGGFRYHRNPSLPTSPVLDPLCGGNPFSGGCPPGRPQKNPANGNPSPTPPGSAAAAAAAAAAQAAATTYDYHAAQLERFLEEYRSLQEQLCRMKETCESLRVEQEDFASGGRTGGSGGSNPMSPTSSGATDDSLAATRSILKKRAAAVAASVAGGIVGSTPPSSSSPMSVSSPGGISTLPTGASFGMDSYVTTPPHATGLGQAPPPTNTAAPGMPAPPPYWPVMPNRNAPVHGRRFNSGGASGTVGSSDYYQS